MESYDLTILDPCQLRAYSIQSPNSQRREEILPLRTAQVPPETGQPSEQEAQTATRG